MLSAQVASMLRNTVVFVFEMRFLCVPGCPGILSVEPLPPLLCAGTVGVRPTALPMFLTIGISSRLCLINKNKNKISNMKVERILCLSS